MDYIEIPFIGGARWRKWLARSAAIVELKQLSQWSVIGWVNKNYYLELLRASEGTLSRWSRLHLQSLAPTNPHWARVVRERAFSSLADLFCCCCLVTATHSKYLPEYKQQICGIQGAALGWMLETAGPVYRPSRHDYQHALNKIMFVESAEVYSKCDNWPPESERTMAHRVCCEAPLPHHNLLRIIFIGLSKDIPVAPAEALELVEQLVRRACSLPPEDNPLIVDKLDIADYIFQLCQFNPPENITLPPGYTAPALAITGLYWRGWALLLMLAAHNPATFAARAAAAYPTLRALIEMCITTKPSIEWGNNGTNEMERAETERAAILQLEAHLAAASCTKHTVTEHSSRLLSQLTTLDPLGPARKPPQSVIETIQALNTQLRLGRLLCRQPALLLDLVERQGTRRAMPWLHQLMRHDQLELSVLPVQCLCEFLAAGAGGSGTGGAGDGKAGELCQHLRRTVAACEQGARAVLHYYLQRLSHHHAATRAQAQRGLKLVLTQTDDTSEMDYNADVGPEEWLELVWELQHWAAVRSEVAARVRAACLVECIPSHVAAYVGFLARHVAAPPAPAPPALTALALAVTTEAKRYQASNGTNGPFPYLEAVYTYLSHAGSSIAASGARGVALLRAILPAKNDRLSEIAESLLAQFKCVPGPITEVLRSLARTKAVKQETVPDVPTNATREQLIAALESATPSTLEAIGNKMIDTCSTALVVDVISQVLENNQAGRYETKVKSEDSFVQRGHLFARGGLGCGLLLDWLSELQQETLGAQPERQMRLMFRRGWGAWRPQLATQLAHRASWRTLHACTSALLDPTSEWAPRAVVEFCATLVESPRVWQGRDRQPAKHAPAIDTLRLSYSQLDVLIRYVVAEAREAEAEAGGGEAGVEAMRRRMEARLPLVLRCCPCPAALLHAALHDTTLLPMLYMQVPKIQQLLAECSERPALSAPLLRALQSSSTGRVASTSATDRVSHALLTALAVPHHQPHAARVARLEAGIRGVWARTWGAGGRALPLCGALLRGAPLSKHHHHLLAAIELLPDDELIHSEEIHGIVDCYLSVCKQGPGSGGGPGPGSGSGSGRDNSLPHRVAALLRRYMALRPSKAAALLHAHRDTVASTPALSALNSADCGPDQAQCTYGAAWAAVTRFGARPTSKRGAARLNKTSASRGMRCCADCGAPASAAPPPHALLALQRRLAPPDQLHWMLQEIEAWGSRRGGAWGGPTHAASLLKASAPLAASIILYERQHVVISQEIEAWGSRRGGAWGGPTHAASLLKASAPLAASIILYERQHVVISQEIEAWGSRRAGLGAPHTRGVPPEGVGPAGRVYHII
ncbi:hypothetical protein evm_000664 [Chilo suppressalis]|nr:hypothetical protein evm_000664 [Chilo suppressalis]